MKIGFIALTDCASIIMAEKLGYFAERDLEVTIEKQANWPGTRDNLLNGQIDAAHCLFSMPLSLATGIGESGTALKIAMVLNHNGQAITLNKDFASVGYGDLEKAKAALESKEPTLAMTFPGGTHDTWLRYWLKATKADQSKVKITPIPPPQMVANMKAGNMDGYCVGEPWNAVAVDEGVGFTHLTTQDIWRFHPEKALVAKEREGLPPREVAAWAGNVPTTQHLRELPAEHRTSRGPSPRSHQAATTVGRPARQVLRRAYPLRPIAQDRPEHPHHDSQGAQGRCPQEPCPEERRGRRRRTEAAASWRGRDEDVDAGAASNFL